MDRSPEPGPGRIVVGWSEFVGLPEWGIARLKAKVDTGALSSALHVGELCVPGRPQGEWRIGDPVRLLIPLHRRHPDRLACVSTHIIGAVRVTNTGRTVELRPVVETALRMGGAVARVRLSLTDRTGLMFRLILGRRALAGRYTVDPGTRHLCRRGRPGPGRAAP